MKLLHLFFGTFFIGCSFFGLGQTPELTPLSKISVLTCGPGEELYASFGHSAFHVQDTSLGIDVVYNYGIFDDSSKYFYLKFIQGQMDYRLARQRFPRFLAEYEYYDRWVKEQDLNLSLIERNALFRFLERNNLPENQVYSYDFFFDNCSTKVWEVLKTSLGDPLVFDDTYLKNTFTFRQLIHQNLDTNSWSAFGIDLALGSVIDVEATPEEHMYLPAYTLDQLQTAKLNNEPLVSSISVLYQSKSLHKSGSFLMTPLFWLLVILLIVVFVTYRDFTKKRRSRWLDFTLFFVTGLAGVLLLFLWFLTDHSQTVSNFNVLWVFPINVIIAFILVKRTTPPEWIKKYLWTLLVLILIIPFIWLFKIQVFSPLVIFILLALGIRYLFLQHLMGQPEIYKSK